MLRRTDLTRLFRLWHIGNGLRSVQGITASIAVTFGSRPVQSLCGSTPWYKSIRPPDNPGASCACFSDQLRHFWHGASRRRTSSRRWTCGRGVRGRGFTSSRLSRLHYEMDARPAPYLPGFECQFAACYSTRSGDPGGSCAFSTAPRSADRSLATSRNDFRTMPGSSRRQITPNSTVGESP
jgi:hypothetical protein